SGIEYVYTPQNKVKLKIKLSGEGQQRYTRADTLGDEFEPSAITETIETAQKKAAAEEAMEKFLAARRARQQAELALLNRTSAKPAEPTPTPTTTTKPTVAEPTAPKPIESKAPEKKKDPWAEIRGMRDSDKMIADLEAGGITSLDDLRGFFWNFKHPDDHTDELTELRTKIEPIDKLIAMMEQHSLNYAIYKEYQERTAFTQKHFRKKNAAAIDAFEEADKYIAEHIKPYYIKGKMPKQNDLQAKSTKLKEKYNALLPEHNAFVTKRDTAHKYTRQVRNYLQNKEQQDRNRQYREKKRTQQRRKDTLE
ncbi:MAG: conjugal transfer protein, partial [Ruminococcus sp.]|nr:conjugal transfer protein [Ruminococcus sp.]